MVPSLTTSDRVTQKQIAAALGVSISLVSRVLAGRGAEIGVAAATSARILAAARAAGYVPSAAARILRGRRSRTLGVVVADFADPFLGVMIGELLPRARALGHTLLLAGGERRRLRADDLRPLLQQEIEGLLVLGSGPVASWIEPFERRGLRRAQVGQGPGRPGLLSVALDEAAAFDHLLAHLAARGHRRLAFLGGLGFLHDARARIFTRAVARHGLECRPAWDLRAAENDVQATLAMVTGLARRWSARRGPTALVAANDVLAFGALRALAEVGLCVPGDLAVTGYDDLPLAALAPPGLTTLRQPLADMCAAALAWVTEPGPTKTAPAPRRFVPELVVRASTGGDAETADAPD
ncbi:MAG: LacI family transcriptional regulator [Candidatus Marinimicrobia bacterium]|nr:LacI family transcriptional regulator [Candidatus Neomarinimicrobiota bacterium]